MHTLLRWNKAYDQLPDNTRFFAFFGPFVLCLLIATLCGGGLWTLVAMLPFLIFRLPVMLRPRR